MFDNRVENCIIGKSFAAPIGTLSWRVFDIFFVSLEGKILKFNELIFDNGTLRIEWRDQYDVTDVIGNHFDFRIMPVEAIPTAVFQGRQTAFQNRLMQSDAKPSNFRAIKITDLKNSKLPGKFVKQDAETDIDFEFRIISYCREIFAAIKKRCA